MLRKCCHDLTDLTDLSSSDRQGFDDLCRLDWESLCVTLKRQQGASGSGLVWAPLAQWQTLHHGYSTGGLRACIPVLSIALA